MIRILISIFVWGIMVLPLVGQVRLFQAAAFAELPNVRDLAISPDGAECWFTVESVKKEASFIAMVSRNTDAWKSPQLAPFSGKYRDLEPAFSPDGKRLYFASNRPLKQGDESKDFDIWYVERVEKGWSEPVNMGSPVNSDGNEYYPSVTKSGNVYFTAQREGGIGGEDIFVCERDEWGDLAPAHPLSEGVNSAGPEFNAYVSPDETFILFGSYGREDGLGGGDLYLSFRKRNKSWAKALHLPPGINSKYLDFCPFMDHDFPLLYFTSDRSNVLQNIPLPSDFQSLVNVMTKIYPNGQSRLYMIDLGDVVRKMNVKGDFPGLRRFLED